MPRDTPDDPRECYYRTRDSGFGPCKCKIGKCVAPTEDEVRAANAKDYNLIVVGDKVFAVSLCTSSEIHGDGTMIYRESHFDGRPTKITTIRRGRRKVTYES